MFRLLSALLFSMFCIGPVLAGTATNSLDKALEEARPQVQREVAGAGSLAPDFSEDYAYDEAEVARQRAKNRVRVSERLWRRFVRGTRPQAMLPIMCPHPDYDALMALYNSTDGPNWTNNTGWVDGAAGTDCDPCTGWFGVSCDESGRVISISLSSNQLDGSLPAELGQLDSLTELSLTFNQLVGNIPSELGQLNNLNTLVLVNNQLTNSIPAELWQLNNLYELSLSWNQLTGSIPVELGRLNNLNTLDLSHNHITGSIPGELGQLSNLKNFLLFDNELFGSIPANLENLSGLDRMYLHNNNLSGCYPEGFSAYCPLGVGDTSFFILTDGYSFLNNPLLPYQGDYERICNGEPQFDATCDDGDLNTTNDVINDDCGCGRYACDRTRDSLALVAFYNATNGPGWTNSNGWLTNSRLEDWAGINTNGNCVSRLSIGFNEIAGNIPPELGQLISLETLYLGNNQFVGEIPPELGQLINLKSLDLTGNQLTGSIPSELGQLISLIGLHLGNNQLTGLIPSELGNLSSLQFLSLYTNQLIGPIPSALGGLSGLQHITLSNNQLTGSIPDEFGELLLLKELNLSTNQLTGNIPSELENLSNLNKFYLHNNNLSGCYQNGLSVFCALGSGDTSRTYLNGYSFLNNPLLPYQGDYERACNAEPQVGATCDDGDPNTTNDVINDDCGCGRYACDRTQDSLALVALYNAANGPGWGNSDNWLTTAPLEEWHGLSTNGNCVIAIDLRDNGLVGILPAEFWNLTGLESLRLQRNQIGGELSGNIGELRELRTLYLNENLFSGSIPSEIGQLTFLDWLDLSRNSFTGTIPTEVSQLTSLRYLNFGYNQLTGSIPAELGQMSALERLLLNNNQLTGAIPSELGQLDNVSYFYLHSNLLEGCIPVGLADVCSLNPGDTTSIDAGYSLLNNPRLPFQGDYERICDGEVQIGAPCDDGNIYTFNDLIDAECNCQGQPFPTFCVDDGCGDLLFSLESMNGEVLFCEGDTIKIDNNSEQGFDFFLVDWGYGPIDTINTYQTIEHIVDTASCSQLVIEPRFTGYTSCEAGVSCGTATIVFAIRPTPRAQAVIPSTVSAGEVVEYISSSCSTTSVTWDFGNDVSIVGDTISYGYPEEGIYTIRLIATGDEECSVTSDTLEQVIEVLSSTCTDGIQNGNETGVDCGGPDCAPCPDNTNLSIGLTDTSGTIGETVCVDIVGANFTEITGFQFSVTFDTLAVRYVSGSGSINGTNVFIGFIADRPHELRLSYSPFSSTGYTDPGPFVIGQLCFVVEQEIETELEIEDTPIRLEFTNEDFDILLIGDVNVDNGMINAGNTGNPTCSDGIQNGDETGVDCGGSCTPCISTTCGEGTTSPEICLGSECGDVGTEICIPVYVGNFNQLAGLQFSLSYTEANLAYTRFTAANAFQSGVAVSNPSDSTINLVWNDPDLNGVTFSAEEVAFEVCFTVQTVATTPVAFRDETNTLRFFDIVGTQISGSGNPGSVNQNCGGGDTCNDGIQNGNEIGVDCGGPDCLPCMPNENLTFAICNTTATIGTEVCLDISVFNLENLFGLQLEIGYDPEILEFTRGISTEQLAGLQVANYSAGMLRVLWFDPNAGSNSVPDGEQILSVCFNVLNDNQTAVFFRGELPVRNRAIDSNNMDISPIELIDGSVNTTSVPTIINAEIEGLACRDDTNGSVTIWVCDDNNLSYQWSGSASTNSTAVGLGAGTYCVTVTNLTTDESVSECYELVNPEPFSVAVASVNGVTCFGAGDGQITLETTGNTGPYLINWSGSLPDNVTQQDNLPGGIYSVSVTDANGCVRSLINMAVAEPAPLDITGAITNIPSPAPGNIDIAVVGGSGPFEYSWTGPNSYTSSEEDPDDITEPGTYCVTVTDTNECEDTQCFAINMALAIVQADVTGNCGSGDCSIDVTVGGGLGGYSYQWTFNGAIVATTEDLATCEAGDYLLRVISGQDTVTQTITVAPETTIVATTTVISDTEDTACSGMIELDISGGLAPYEVSWSAGSLTLNGAVIAQLCAGTYTPAIIDAAGCSTLLPPVVLGRIDEAVESITDVNCADGENGGIDLTISGGVAPYTFQWFITGESDVLTDTEDLTGVPAGDYTVSIKDATGAQLFRNYTIGISAAFSITEQVTSDYSGFGVSCFGANDGAIRIIPNGETDLTYEISYAGEVIGVDSVLDNLAAGTYLIVASDEGGCEITSSVEITAPPVMTIAATLANNGCGNTRDGNIALTVSGGVEPYEFLWSTGSMTDEISALNSGEYAVTVTDANGCNKEATYVLTENFNITIDSMLCTYESISVNGRTYNISNPSGREELQTIAGCDSIININLSFYDVLRVENIPVSLCVGDTLRYNNEVISAEAGLYERLFTTEDGNCDSLQLLWNVTLVSVDSTIFQDTICMGEELVWNSLSLTTPGRYEAIRSNSSGDCELIEVLYLTVISPEDIRVLEDSYALQRSDESLLMPLLLNDTVPYLYDIAIVRDPDKGTVEFMDDNIFFTPDGVEFGPDSFRYEICFAQCPDFCEQAWVRLDIDFNCILEFTLNIPNGFTPNGDGKNDFFDPVATITGDCLDQLGGARMAIRNIQSEIVFEASGEQPKWDGTDKKGRILPVGTYWYIFEIEGQEDVISGAVELVR